MIADAHSHYGWFRPEKIANGPGLSSRMREAGVSLLAWTITSDGPWIRMGTRRFEQVATPSPGQLEQHFFRSIDRVRRLAERAGLPFATTPADIDRSARGDPFLVLAGEAADFLEGEIAGLERAYGLGLRHLQLVHYIRNPIGDIQTEAPVHGGLTAFGREVVQHCNRLGLLVDLAHCSRNTVDMALDVTTAAPIWSHSTIGLSDEHWTQPGGLARQLNIGRARAIAARGGAIGLWALGSSTGKDAGAYADSLLRAVDLVGARHVMIGSDMDGFGPRDHASLAEPADLRRVVDSLLARRVDDAVVDAVCFGNYARCLRAAMAQRSA